MKIQDWIIFEDQHMIVCRKEAGVAVQSARMSQMDMESALKNYLAGKNAAKNAGKMPYLGVIHRLDQPVRGVLVFAKTPFAAKELNRQLTSHQLGKHYLAEVTGEIPKEEGTLEDYLLKDGKTNTSKVVTAGTPGAKKAVLHYKKAGEHLLEIHLVTGRHHQIRVQCAHAGMPLKGDTKYDPQAQRGEILGLCAYHLELYHPKTGKKMDFYYDKKES